MIDSSTDTPIDAALRAHQAGRFAEAEAAYREVLRKDPRHADALHLLGVLTGQMGRIDEAVELINSAIAANSQVADYHVNLAEFLRRRGDLRDAMAACGRALLLDPERPELHNTLGVALNDYGERAEAAAAFEQATRLRPDYAEAWNNLANVLRDLQKPSEARAAAWRAVELAPSSAAAHNSLGNALRAGGDRVGAAVAFRKALAIDPRHAEAHGNLGGVLREMGQRAQGLEQSLKAVEIAPRSAGAHNNLASALWSMGRVDDAIATCRAALRLAPDSASVYANLGAMLADTGKFNDAITCFRRAIALKPASSAYHSHLLFTLWYHPDFDSSRILAEHETWAAHHALPAAAQRQPHTNERGADRRLRIGYVSPDLRQHPIGALMLPVLEHHDARQVEIFCYAEVAAPDAMTQRVRERSDHWRITVGMSDAQLIEMIRRDGIDILVDLALHSGDNRLLVFAAKPAPVQITWLGYPGTTGLTSIDFRLSDPFIDPPAPAAPGSTAQRVVPANASPGSTDAPALSRDAAPIPAAASMAPSVADPISATGPFAPAGATTPSPYSEATILLPHCFWCYAAPAAAAEVNALPALTAGHITFGCLNRFAKVSKPSLHLWAQVMKATARSRLLLQAPEGSARAEVTRMLQAQDIDADRVEFVGRVSDEEYFRLFHRIDMMLDPIPYPGHTTTLDSLWMGVPPVTLAGNTAPSRGGASLLSNVRLFDLIATSAPQYISIATSLATDLPRLASLRASLRAAMKASPAMDAAGFTADLERIYRQLWVRWCDRDALNQRPTAQPRQYIRPVR